LRQDGYDWQGGGFKRVETRTRVAIVDVFLVLVMDVVLPLKEDEVRGIG